MNSIIDVKNLGKKYAIKHHKGGYIALRDVLTIILKSPIKFISKKAKEIVGIDTEEDFWALRNINFTVKKGEVIGIIGSNGAGKSTLLKILTGITPPTEGEVIMRGTVSSLLEVGTGFHPELTGRENIFLNGAILGMTRKDLVKKFDAIVEFAGIEKFLDTPVKRYSSGMYVRLAFSVAAHLEPDILLVDEVLAVGDTEFQKKCLGKMEEVSKDSGRTILFVSHNLSAVRNLCERSILIDKGRVAMVGSTNDVINFYLSSAGKDQKSVYEFEEQTTPASIRKVSIFDNNNHPQTSVPISTNFKIVVDFTCKNKIENATLALLFYSSDRDLLLYSTDADITGKYADYQKGSYQATINIPAFLFNVGRYTLDIMLCTPNIGIFGEQKNLGFEICNINNPRSVNFRGNHVGRIATPFSYHIKLK